MLSRADIKQGLLLMTTTSASSSADTGSPTSVLSSDWSCQSVVSDAEQPSLTRKSRHEQALKPEEINMVRSCCVICTLNYKSTSLLEDCTKQYACVCTGA